MMSQLKIFLGLAAILAVVACDPCRSLGEKICECAENAPARDSCRRSLDMFTNMKGFKAATNPERCQEILKSEACTCPAINSGLVENCGMTR